MKYWKTGIALAGAAIFGIAICVLPGCKNSDGQTSRKVVSEQQPYEQIADSLTLDVYKVKDNTNGVDCYIFYGYDKRGGISCVQVREPR